MHSRHLLRLTIVLFVLGATCAFADNTAIVPTPGGGEKWFQRHEEMNKQAQAGNIDLVYIGDSIVGNWKWEGKPVWDEYYAKRGGLNLGISGDRTEQVLWRLDHGNVEGIHPKLTIIMIGQNNAGHNTADEITEGVTAVVNKVREKLPESKILLLGIFYRREKPTEERDLLKQVNANISKLADEKTIFYMDICNIFLNPVGSIPAELMPDFEHPSEKGHRIWAEGIEPKVKELMGEK